MSYLGEITMENFTSTNNVDILREALEEYIYYDGSNMEIIKYAVDKISKVESSFGLSLVYSINRNLHEITEYLIDKEKLRETYFEEEIFEEVYRKGEMNIIKYVIPEYINDEKTLDKLKYHSEKQKRYDIIEYLNTVEAN